MSDALTDYTAHVRDLFGPTPTPWVSETGTDHDVLVVGAGQAGLGVGFALRRFGISRVSVIDAAAPGEKGVWRGIARMRRLRTPKVWPDPEFGFPELSFRSWFTRLHGRAAYEDLDRIPRTTWADYLDWIEQVVEVPVRHRTRLLDVEPGPRYLSVRLEVTDAAGGRHQRTETTRKLVLANGVESTGGPAYPAAIAGLPAHLKAHTADRIDLTALTGRRVAVLGAGASALDIAGAALESGAAEVHLFVRRDELVVQGPGVVGGLTLGARESFHRLSDADRWQRKVVQARAGRSCTLESVQRAAAFDGFHVHLDAEWHTARAVGDRIVAEAADGIHEVDLVIAGTGYQYDPATRPDLARLAADIATWGDRYHPPADLAHDELARWPYLGDGYELSERSPGSAPWLGRVHVFSAAAGLSFGIPVGDVMSLATGIPRLVDAIGHDLYVEDQAAPTVAGTPAAAASFRDAYAHAIWTPDLAEDLRPTGT
ncbi:FAD-dependent oxidoreductase [Nocardioides sp. NPDC057577]|uniref:FAD-dependent oxidoreductase n=1 Tax=Nocardioides sp. NPDC057577 TaxID=3346171 RepID=UPI003671A78B